MYQREEARRVSEVSLGRVDVSGEAERYTFDPQGRRERLGHRKRLTRGGETMAWTRPGGSDPPNFPLGGRRKRCWIRPPQTTSPFVNQESLIWVSVEKNSIITDAPTPAKTREYIS